jgi:hypothetical protein
MLLADAVCAVAARIREDLGPDRRRDEYLHALDDGLRGMRIRARAQVPLTEDAEDCGCRVPLLVEERLVVDVRADGEPLAIARPRLRFLARVSGARDALLLDFRTPAPPPRIWRIEVAEPEMDFVVFAFREDGTPCSRSL